jgi:hypothetical protein
VASRALTVEAPNIGLLTRLFELFPQVFADKVDIALDMAGAMIAGEAKDTTAFTDRTGNLRNSIQHEVLSGQAVVVWPGMEYGAAVELGTDPATVGQKIFPKTAKVLAWPDPSGAGMVFRAWSTVAARKARPFMQPAFEAKRAEVEQLFADMIDVTLAELGA